MRRALMAALWTVLNIIPFLATAQETAEQHAVVEEGKKLYRLEMASWHGTDILREKFPEKMNQLGGYISYEQLDATICVFFSSEEPPMALASMTFDSTFSKSSVLISSRKRSLRDDEYDIIAMRQNALKEIHSDTLFKRYENTDLNLIPVIDAKERRIYVVTGPKQAGVVIFGNDYLLTFDNDNRVVSKRKLHHNLIPIEFRTKDGKVTDGAAHSHNATTGDLITATDICTLMLYQEYTGWNTHFVITQKYNNMWLCKSHKLVLLPLPQRNAGSKEKKP